jgi:hypothetical protein
MLFCHFARSCAHAHCEDRPSQAEVEMRDTGSFGAAEAPQA